MLPILAQTAPASHGDWMNNAMFVLLIFVAALQVYRLISPRTEKREVSFTSDAVTKKEFEAHCAHNAREHENLFTKMGGMERGIRTEIKGDLEKVHASVAVLSREVGALNEVGEVRSQQMARMDAKLDRLVERGGDR
jgi:hypothetical protein